MNVGREHRLSAEVPGHGPRARSAQQVRETARLLRIEHLLSSKTSKLSGGDRQRVALGRAIVRRPKAFLMDEPLGALDAEFRHLMCDELRDLHDRIGATTVYVTHDQLEAMSMADQIAVMNQRRGRADRLAAGDLRSAGQHVRRRLHRLAADELPAASRPACNPATGRSSFRDARIAVPEIREDRAAASARARRASGAYPLFRRRAGPRRGVRCRISRHHADRHRRHRAWARRGAAAVAACRCELARRWASRSSPIG